MKRKGNVRSKLNIQSLSNTYKKTWNSVMFHFSLIFLFLVLGHIKSIGFTL